MENTKNKDFKTSAIQKNKALIKKLYEESLNKRNWELLDELVDEDFTGLLEKKGADGFRQPLIPLINAFPDIAWRIEEMISEENHVNVRWTWQGTHSGQFQHLPPTNKKVVNEGVASYELADGKIIRAHVLTDRLGFLQQLEATPHDLTLLSKTEPDKNEVSFIDKFFVPKNGRDEFMERVNVNRNFIKNLPGFIKDNAYERTDENGNIIFITVAIWKNQEAVKKAKEAVQEAYKKEGFNPEEMLERLGITMDRGVYKEYSIKLPVNQD